SVKGTPKRFDAMSMIHCSVKIKAIDPWAAPVIPMIAETSPIAKSSLLRKGFPGLASTCAIVFITCMAAARKGLTIFTSIICSPSLTLRNNLGEFFSEHCRTKRFDNVVADLGLDCLDNVFFLGLGSNHQEGKAFKPFIRPHPLQQFKPGHRWHVPV